MGMVRPSYGVLVQQLCMIAFVHDHPVMAAMSSAHALVAGTGVAMWNSLRAAWQSENSTNHSDVYRAMLESHADAGLPNNTLLAFVLQRMLNASDASHNIPPLSYDDLQQIKDDDAFGTCHAGSETCSSTTRDASLHADESGCYWWSHASPLRSDVACHSSRSHRMHRALIGGAEEKALACFASNPEAECILSHEVGLMLPGLFILDSSTLSLQTLLLPVELADDESQLLWAAHDVAADDVRSVRVFQQCKHRRCPSIARPYRRHIAVEYTNASGGGMRVERTVASGRLSFCIQLLRDSLEPGCLD